MQLKTVCFGPYSNEQPKSILDRI